MSIIIEFIKRHVSGIVYVLVTAVACAIELIYYKELEDFVFFENVIYMLLTMLTLYKLWFKHSYKDIGLEFMCILALVIATNKLYSYKHLVELIPQIENTEQHIIILGFAASIMFTMTFCAIYGKIRAKKTGNTKDNDICIRSIDSVSTKNDEGTDVESELYNEKRSSAHNETEDRQAKSDSSIRKREKYHNIGEWLMTFFIMLVALAAPFGIDFAVRKWGQDAGNFRDRMQESIGYIVYYALLSSAVLFFLLLIIHTIKSFCLIIKRNNSHQETDNKSSDPLLLYGISVFASISIMVISYLASGVTLTSYFKGNAYSDFLTIVLMGIITLVTFLVLVQLIHGIVTALPFANNLNKDDSKFGNRINNIIDLIIEIALSSIETVLEFIRFIPSFFLSLKGIAFPDDTDCDNDDSSEA